jgi:hypothetical protein
LIYFSFYSPCQKVYGHWPVRQAPKESRRDNNQKSGDRERRNQTYSDYLLPQWSVALTYCLLIRRTGGISLDESKSYPLFKKYNQFFASLASKHGLNKGNCGCALTYCKASPTVYFTLNPP